MNPFRWLRLIRLFFHHIEHIEEVLAKMGTTAQEIKDDTAAALASSQSAKAAVDALSQKVNIAIGALNDIKAKLDTGIQTGVGLSQADAIALRDSLLSAKAQADAISVEAIAAGTDLDTAVATDDPDFQPGTDAGGLAAQALKSK